MPCVAEPSSPSGAIGRVATLLVGALIVVASLAGCGSPAPPGNAPTERAGLAAQTGEADGDGQQGRSGDGAPSSPAGSAGASLRPAPTVPPLATPDGGGAGGGADPAVAPSARDISGPAPFVPAGLVMPSGRRAPVVAADTAADGVLAVPEDPAVIGWWTGGARIGDPYGSTVLAGHVDSRGYGVGVLAELGRAAVGDRVAVTAGTAGTARQDYRVVSVEQVPKARLAADTAVFDQSGAPRLVLITCGGRFDPAARAYEDNLVVIAEPVG